MDPTFIRTVTLLREQVPDFNHYPFNLPVVRDLDTLELHPRVTFFAGENGSGKSTLLEAIAVAAGFNPEGGTRSFNFATRNSESELHRFLRLVRGYRRHRTGFFLRAESYFNVGTVLEQMPDILQDAYGGVSPHDQSHGESFLMLVRNRFWANGLYILDEPEAALSPQHQLTLLRHIDDLARRKSSQLIIATHSPILLAYPDARIYWLSKQGLAPIAYEDTEHYRLTRDFLLHRERYLRDLMSDDDED
ncbi:AAA family ATPase [Vitiosangium sp. GDMCC 1.1324]|uniref:AAA family ATPase n=1 Tax=Vitiosangium sp. (strain GDMCC 1.1324) TaxID=2138576 RepID=UPI000D3BFB1E|nr:AAA family ATPase [Vitiosangium sp. GDMCC 1.1324]PTL83566.1 AAA family ATPase [Vitiosangium sp. GDMCC 1.1324]